MKANELRLGNYLQDSVTKTTLEVIVLSKDMGIYTWVIDRSKYPLPDGWQLEPIPLTEEWLLKFGFKKYPNCRDTFRQEYYDSFQLVIDEHTIISFSIPIGYNDIRCNYDKLYRSEEKKQSYRVKHIHQLQNLFFALTGEELTFKSE